MYTIGIDVGNFDTKSQHTTTPSGYMVFNSKPAILSEYLLFNGKYYTPTTKRFMYEKDKTRSDRCIILSLFAIAKEIHYTVRNTREKMNDIEVQNLINNIREINIGVGLPPSHFVEKRIKELREYYDSYLGKGVEFEWSGFKYHLSLKHCRVYPQGGAGAVDGSNKFRTTYPSYYVIDIGGYTIDTLKFLDNTVDGMWASHEEGVVTIFDDIIEQVKMDHDLTLDYETIENILRGRNVILDDTRPEVVNAVKSIAKDRAVHIIDMVRQNGIEFASYPCVFLGGGALLLKDYITMSPLINEKACLFIDDPCVNAKGFAKFAMTELEKKAS